MKYIVIINESTQRIYDCPTAQPHGYLRELLMEAQLNGWKVEKVEG